MSEEVKNRDEVDLSLVGTQELFEELCKRGDAVVLLILRTGDKQAANSTCDLHYVGSPYSLLGTLDWARARFHKRINDAAIPENGG